MFKPPEAWGHVSTAQTFTQLPCLLQEPAQIEGLER